MARLGKALVAVGRLAMTIMEPADGGEVFIIPIHIWDTLNLKVLVFLLQIQLILEYSRL